jgi:putative tryptophan/tyrosine transport system substrate-binding protein
MRWREFIAGLGSVVTLPLAARAQVRQRIPVIGYLDSGTAGTDRMLNAWRQGLDQGGYVEGKNVEILFSYAEFQNDRLRSLFADLVHRGVDVIVASGGASALTAKEATATIPMRDTEK